MKDCPKCGCNDWEKTGTFKNILGAKHQRFECANCATEGSEAIDETPIEQGVDYFVFDICCPRCTSPDTKITSSPRPIRWHKCCTCGAAFKSVERQIRCGVIAP